MYLIPQCKLLNIFQPRIVQLEAYQKQRRQGSTAWWGWTTSSRLSTACSTSLTGANYRSKSFLVAGDNFVCKGTNPAIKEQGFPGQELDVSFAEHPKWTLIFAIFAIFVIFAIFAIFAGIKAEASTFVSFFWPPTKQWPAQLKKNSDGRFRFHLLQLTLFSSRFQ